MLALSSRRFADPKDRLAPIAKSVAALGFSEVYAEAPPADAARARAALDEAGVAVVAVGARPCDDAASLSREADRAADAAAALKIRRIVVEAWRPPAGALDAARDAARQAAVDALARTLYGIFGRHQGISVALRNADSADGLVGFGEAEWLLSDLKDRGLGLWFDPARAAGLARASKGPPALDWADRYGARILGVTIALPDRDGGLGLHEESSVDWGTLRESVPSGAARVLDVGPKAAERAVLDARRYFEQVLGW